VAKVLLVLVLTTIAACASPVTDKPNPVQALEPKADEDFPVADPLAATKNSNSPAHTYRHAKPDDLEDSEVSEELLWAAGILVAVGAASFMMLSFLMPRQRRRHRVTAIH
jgi:hypothetical protein